MSAYLNTYQVLSTAVMWGMENNHGITMHFIILNLPITIRVKQFWWDNVTVHRRWSLKGDGGKGALMADTGFHFYHDHLLECWWVRGALNTTTKRKSRTVDNRENVMLWLDSGDQIRRTKEEQRAGATRTEETEGCLVQREEKYEDIVRKPWTSLVIQWLRIHLPM